MRYKSLLGSINSIGVDIVYYSEQENNEHENDQECNHRYQAIDNHFNEVTERLEYLQGM